VLIVAEDGASASVVETYAGSGGGVYFTNAVTEIACAPGARVDHNKLQQESPDAFHVATAHARLDHDAVFVSHSGTIGAKLTRNDLNVVLAGPHAEATLNGLVDFERINRGDTRLTVGAANVRTSQMRYFDSREMALDVRHVMASGALPPAFPAIRIDGELYWDGGVLSNTPVEAVFDDKPRRNGLVFAVHVWNPNGSEPDSILKVMNRQKDLQYSSRAGTHIARQRQIHRLRHIISELAARLPQEALQDNFVREMASYGCPTRMHVVRLLAPQVRGEDHAKDIDFSPSGIRTRWEAGYADANRVLKAQPWAAPVDPIEGFILHEANADEMQDQPQT